MRKLMWFTVGFGSACALCVYLLPDWLMMPLMLLLLPGAMAFWKWEKLRPGMAVCLGAAAAIGWFLLFRQFYLLPARSLDGQQVNADVTITTFSWETDYGIAADGEMTLSGKTYKLRLYIDDPVALAPGDTVRGNFSMRYTAPGGSRDATFHAGKKILLLGYQEDGLVVSRANGRSVRYLGEYFSRFLCDRLEALFPGEIFAFVKALLLGKAEDLTYRTDTALSVSGIRHIIAVSGLHVAMLYTLIRNVTFRRPWLTALLGIPTLLLFAAAVGFTPSVIRACLMVGLMMLARLFDREYDSATALAFAVLVMLLLNPLTVTSISFQMSVGCVMGILMFQQRLQDWFFGLLPERCRRGIPGRVLRWLISSVSVTLSATGLTMPLSALYFGTVSLVGMLTNLLTLWVIQWIFIGTVAALVVSLFAFRAALVLAGGISWMVRYVTFAAGCLARIPLAAVYTQSIFVVFWLVFVYLLLIIFLLSRDRQPLALFCCGVIGLCAALLCSWVEPGTDDVRLTALDVGQGQCLILQCDGQTFLIDCGGGNDATTADLAARKLLSQGVTTLDGIVLTHGDRDHAGALENLLCRVSARWIMAPVTSYPELVRNLEKSGSSPVILVREDLMITLKEGTMKIFGPIFAAESNENSLCVLFERKNCAILVTGDRGWLGEQMLIRTGQLTDVDLLIAGHHGSRYSTSEALLEAVKPETVIISVGANNAYGHPSPETMQRLKDFGCTVYRTDQNGTIIFRR